MDKKYLVYAFLTGLAFRQIELAMIKFYTTPGANWRPEIWLSYGVFAVIIFCAAYAALRITAVKLSSPGRNKTALKISALIFVWISLSLNMDLTVIHSYKLINTVDWFYVRLINASILILPLLSIVYLIIKKTSSSVPSTAASSKKPVVSYALIAFFLLESIVVSYLFPIGSIPENKKYKNVILISVDTLRKDHISLFGYPRKTTPNLDAFFENDFRFDRCITVLPETGPSYTSIFTGSYPFQHRVYTNGTRFSPRVTNSTTIAKELQDAGYYTSSFLTASIPGTFTHLEYGLDELYQKEIKIEYKGGGDLKTLFDNLVSRITISMDSCRKPHLIAPATKTAVKWLDSRPQEPFYTHIYWHYPHSPYGDQGKALETRLPGEGDKREPFASASADDIQYISDMRDKYDADIYYTDIQIGEVISALKRNGYLENSIIVFTSDHGEELGAREFEGAPYFGHSLWIYESSVNVPLIFHLPGGSAQSNSIPIPVSTIDIAPSILTLLGLSIPNSMKGVSLFTENGELRTDLAEVQPWAPAFNITRNPKVLKDYIGIFKQDWAYIKNESLEEEELYNIREDAFAANNVITLYPAELDSFRNIESGLIETIIYKNNFAHLIDQDVQHIDRNISQRAMDNLRALGYVK